MVNQPNYGDIKFTWQAVLWRLLLTALLLAFLAGSGLTIFKDATSQPEARVRPTAAGSIE